VTVAAGVGASPRVCRAVSGTGDRDHLLCRARERRRSNAMFLVFRDGLHARAGRRAQGGWGARPVSDMTTTTRARTTIPRSARPTATTRTTSIMWSTGAAGPTVGDDGHRASSYAARRMERSHRSPTPSLLGTLLVDGDLRARHPRSGRYDWPWASSHRHSPSIPSHLVTSSASVTAARPRSRPTSRPPAPPVRPRGRPLPRECEAAEPPPVLTIPPCRGRRGRGPRASRGVPGRCLGGRRASPARRRSASTGPRALARR
jgi:hypothetical protein